MTTARWIAAFCLLLVINCAALFVLLAPRNDLTPPPADEAGGGVVFEVEKG